MAKPTAAIVYAKQMCYLSNHPTRVSSRGLCSPFLWPGVEMQLLRR